jgi:undecaprenyl-diphosphatase
MVPGFSKWRQHCGWNVSKTNSRTSAAEFSFLAVPTMFGATAKKCYDYYKDGFVLTHDQINLLIINVIAFIVALLAIKSFIGFFVKV